MSQAAFTADQPSEPVPQVEPSFMNSFVQLPELFSPAECQQIIYLNQPATQAQVVAFRGENENELHLTMRNTKIKNVMRLQENRWIYERVIEKIREVNTRYYGFLLQQLTDFQVLEYENTGFYDTHVDIGTGETSRRKLSLVLFLTPRDEYEGGELILKPNFPALPQTLGSAVVFPSYIPHQIKPVTKGVRHTMVTWVIGPCFK